MRSFDWNNKLKKAFQRDNAIYNEEYNFKKREDKVTFICSCGISHTSDIRRICQTTGAFCISCTKKRSNNKREQTSIKKFGVKCNLQIISNESKQKAKLNKIKALNQEYIKEKKCIDCNNIFNTKSLNSIRCKICKSKYHYYKRKEKKSKCIYESIKQLKSKYSEIPDSKLLITKFEQQNKKCFWCNCPFECPKLNNIEYEYNFNIPTLDRIDNSNKLHTIDNINISCRMCNIMRGSCSIESFEEILNILKGKRNIIDLSNKEYINRLSDKRFSINYKDLKSLINPTTIKELFCPISNFPMFLSSEYQFPLLPSGDRITNNNINGDKLDHNIENIQLVCAFINRAKNNINNNDNFITIFNNKFPNRCKNIKVIYPNNYDYIYKYGCFVNKNYADTYLWNGYKLKNKKLFQNRVRRIILHLKQIKNIKNWYFLHKKLPTHNKNNNDELIIYYNLSARKNNNIYNNLLSEFLEDIRTKKEKNNDDWNDMYNKLCIYIKNNNELPKNKCSDTKLYNWVGTQRNKFKNSKLDKKYINILNNNNYWWWTQIHKGYKTHISWFNDNPLMIPNKEKHTSVYNWYSKIKKYYLIKNKNDKNFICQQDKDLIIKIPLFTEWITFDYPISKTDVNYKIFNKKYKFHE